jgi:rRNA small subunit pseudouridine methyltransferase Nep1
VVILAKAGLKLGRDGLIDAYDRTINPATVPADDFLQPYRPDIVHQCLLALYDSELAASGRLQVWIQTERGKTIEVAPNLRPPRTYGRFKGIMERVLQEGSVINREDGKWLLRSTRWSIAPQIPHGAEVFGIHNLESSPVATAVELAKGAVAEPVPNTLQGGLKDVFGFYCISCSDDQNLDGLDFVTKTVCLSKFPTSPHVACIRLCEGFRVATSRATNEGLAAGGGAADKAGSELIKALTTPSLGQKKDAAVVSQRKAKAEAAAAKAAEEAEMRDEQQQ